MKERIVSIIFIFGVFMLFYYIVRKGGLIGGRLNLFEELFLALALVFILLPDFVQKTRK